MGRRTLLTAVVLAAATTVPATASGSSGSDAATTASYIRANYALVSVGHANISRTEAAVRALLGKIRRECPSAAVGSPQDEQSTELSNELIGTMVLAGGRPDRPAVGAYLKAVAGLHWHSASVNRTIGGYVRSLHTLYTMASPDLCGDISRWGAGDFKTLPSATAPFVTSFIPNWVSLGVLPAGLSRYETPELHAIARRSGQFESQLMEMEARLVETYGEIMNELDLNP
jgi:hypothetical protein